jgi:hypothetical protein
MFKSILKILFLCLTIQVFSFSQEQLTQLANLKINFGNGLYVEDMYKYNNLLFTYVLNNYQNYNIGIYDFSDLKDPIEVGRWEKNNYVGDKTYLGYVQYIEDTLMKVGYYAIKIDSSSKKVNHFFWGKNRFIIKDSLMYEIQGYTSLLKIYRIIESTKFHLIKTYNFNKYFEEVNGLTFVGDILYISARNSGMIILNLKNPLDPQEKSILENKDLTGLLRIENKLLVGSEFSNILMYNISDSWNPNLINSVSFSHSIFWGISNYNSACIASDDFSISLISNNGRVINTITTLGNPHSMICDSNTFFIGTSSGLELFEFSDYQNIIQRIKFGANIARPMKFIKNKNLVYVANLGDGLTIIDVSDSTKPFVKGELDLNGYALSLALNDNLIFIADYILGLLVVDVSNPSKPTLLSSLQIPGYATDIDKINNKIFLLNDNNELFVIDITDKTKPSIEFNKKIFEYTEQYGGEYNKIKSVGENIWIKVNDSPVFAFNYRDNNLNEIFRYEEGYIPYTSDMSLADSLLFIVSLNGIHIFNTNKLELVKSNFRVLLSSGPAVVSFDNINKILYMIEVYFDGFSLVTYDFTDFLDPVRYKYYFSVGIWPEAIPKGLIFDNDLIYLLTQDGIKIFTPNKTTGIENKLYCESNPSAFELKQNYPNPFNPTTKIRFSIPTSPSTPSPYQGEGHRERFVSLKVYDILGNEVATLVNEEKPSGTYEVEFDASQFSSGIYFYTLYKDGQRLSKKMCLIK